MRRKTLPKMMSIFAVVMSLVFPIGLVGCSDDVEPVTPYAIKNFVNFVTRIETPITIDSGADIEAGYIIYNHLNDTYKTDKDVQASKSALDDYKSKYDVFKAEQDRLDAEAVQAAHRSRFEKAVNRLPAEDDLALKDRDAITAAYALYENLDSSSRAMSSVAVAYTRLRLADQIVEELECEAKLAEIQAKADKFAEDVESLIEEKITLESANAIEDLQYDYKVLPDEAKEYENVVAAKEKLDVAASEYQVLRDEADVKDFLARIKKLPSAESITLDNKGSIADAEKLYEKMSDAAKAADGVADALEELKAARKKYDELYAADQIIRIQEFIDAANAVPTDINNVDMSWFDVLDNAREKYWELSIDSQGLPEVEVAFDRWNAAQKAFDKKGYKRVSSSTLSFWIADDGNFVIGDPDSVKSHKTALCTLYNLSKFEELDSVTDIIVNVYDNGTYIKSFNLELSDISAGPGHIILSSKISDGLRTIAASDSSIVPGKAYSFSYYIVDEKGEYIKSPETSVVGPRVYNW